MHEAQGELADGSVQGRGGSGRGNQSASARRRKKQIAFNLAHNITPQTVRKEIKRGIEIWKKAEKINAGIAVSSLDNPLKLVSFLKKQMRIEAKNMQFEKAAFLRDRILEIEAEMSKKK